MERAAKPNVGDGLKLTGDVNLTNGLRSLVLQDEVAGAVEGAALGIDINVGVDSYDLGLRDVLIFFKVTLVISLM
jgi:hypothetical protein